MPQLLGTGRRGQRIAATAGVLCAAASIIVLARGQPPARPAPQTITRMLPGGATLFALGGSEIHVPLNAPYQSVRFTYSVTTAAKATAVLWQIGRLPFPGFQGGTTADRQPPGLADWGYLYHGEWNGSLWELDLHDLPAPSGRALPTLKYYARVIPIRSLQSPDIVGQPSNVIPIVRTEGPPAPSPGPSAPPDTSGSTPRPGQEPFDLGRVIYVDHGELDRDRDGLDDSLEAMLADRFKPLFVFDSAESARRGNEPVTLFQARPKGTVGLTNTGWDDQARIVLEYAMLFARDDGYGPSSDCVNAHNGDNETARLEITSRNGRVWVLQLVSAGHFEWPTEATGTYEWSEGAGSWSNLQFENGHPIVYMSAHKHHQYFSTSNDGKDSSYSDWGCNDDVNGNGARVLPNLVSPLPDKRPNNVGEPELFVQSQADPNANYFVDALDAFGYPGEGAWSTKDFKGGLGDDGGETSNNRRIWKKHAFDFVEGFSKFHPLGRLTGRVSDGSGRPIPGLTLYYRPTHPLAVAFGGGRGPWSPLEVDGNGNYDVTVPESLYTLRPAAGGFDFSGVPTSVFAASAKTVTTNFTGTRRSTPSSGMTRSGGNVAAGAGSQAIGVPPGAPGSEHEAKVRQAIARFIKGYSSRFFQLTLDEQLVARDPEALDKGTGVTDPFVELPRRMTIRARLKRGVDASGQVITDPLSMAVAKGEMPIFQGNVPGAKIRARVVSDVTLLDAEGTAVVDTVTDTFGNAYFDLEAGRHPGPVRLELEVVDNPAQPWARFRRRTDPIEIQPAIHGDDTAAPRGPSLTVGKSPGKPPERKRETTMREAQPGAVPPIAGGTASRPPQGSSESAVRTPGSAPLRPATPTVVRMLPRIVEIESLLPRMKASAGEPARQEMAGFGPGWGANAQLFWRPPPPVEGPIRNYPHVRFSIDVAEAGTYGVTLVHTQAPDYGNARVFVRGTPRRDLAGYAPTVRTARVALGDIPLDAGVNEVVVTVLGKDAASTGFVVGLDRIELVRR